jgi:Fanconi anemia group M protein
MQKLYSRGLSPFKSFENLSKKRILDIGNTIQKIEARNYRFMAIFHYVYIINLVHAYELASVEGIYPFLSYFEGLQNREKKSRALQSILANKDVELSIKIAKNALEHGEEHPKMLKVVELAKTTLNGKSTIVFAQYRSTIKKIVELLNKNGIDARAFVGKKGGVTQAHQHQVIEEFRKGAFKILVATSIGEEGLDIPSVDAVVFYEPIPSEIRVIQRRGRAGRMKIGYIIILVTRNTKDEVYLMISRTREKRMREIIEKIQFSLDREIYKGKTHNIREGQQALF